MTCHIIKTSISSREMEMGMPTSQDYWEDEMPSVKGSHRAWHTLMVVSLPFLLSLRVTLAHGTRHPSVC